ncbi:fasciclin domain-containing protein, partial [Bacteroidales bacterium OttesenSCG-928-L03]|nr:fasciclin domain-containing protein [Bacteroidales bacterium OttesenSCG-928-L03]
MKLKNLLLIALCLFSFVRCDDKDEYFERPSWLEDPIYQVLEAEGRFSSYLQCVDRTDYAKVLKGASLSTVFAPNDEAFAAYLKEKGYNSVADIPDELVKELVSYSIVYNKWTSDHLGDVYTGGEYEPGAMKRKTNNYAGAYQDPENNNEWVINETIHGGFSYTIIDYQVNFTQQNYKYLPVYTSQYFNSFPVPLTANDYNTFYPNSTYTGQNVQGGTILKADIKAENGVIHEVSTVNEPLPNIEDLLAGTEYKSFKELLDYKSPITQEYLFKVFIELPTAVRDAFQKRLPYEQINALYAKIYPSFAFSPILENIFNQETGANESETNGYTLFVPTEEALSIYLKDRILQYYGEIEKLPVEVISTLLNTHMVTDQIWPTTYTGALGAMGDFINGAGLGGNDYDSDGVLGGKIASNGVIYLVDHVIKSRFFETVFASIYLNPTFSMMNTAYKIYYENGLREEVMKSPLNGNITERYTLLNFSDQLLKEDGFAFDAVTNTFTNSQMTEGSVEDRMKRLINMHIFPGVKEAGGGLDSEVRDFMTSPIANYNNWGFLVNNYGDVIRYKNNQLQAAGNIEDGTFVSITKVEDEYNNGQVYTVDRMLQYSPRESASDADRFKELSLWQYLDRARKQNPNVSQFVDYVEVCLKAADSDELAGLKAENFYTILMVNNSMMAQARTRGYIKALDLLTTTTFTDDFTFDMQIEYIAQATQF